MVVLVISRLYSRVRYTKQLASDDCKLAGHLRPSLGLMAIRYVHSRLSEVYKVSCQGQNELTNSLDNISFVHYSNYSMSASCRDL